MRSFEIVHNGAWLSVNTLRSAQKWQSKKLKEKWSPIVNNMLIEAGANKLTFENFTVTVRYRSRMDTDNVSSKFFCDGMTELGIIPDDNKSRFRGFFVMPDMSLKHNTYIFTVDEITEGTPKVYTFTI